jgi:hypothetical protein
MAFYKYNDVSFNSIFSTNDVDVSNVTLTKNKINGVSLVFQDANGSVSKQNNINYKATPTNYFANLSAYFIDYLYKATPYTITVNTKCKELRVLLCGAGGSGGAGAGDTPNQVGESGSGGGGGAYYYYSHAITTAFTYKLKIGRGGFSVSGSGGGNGGASGVKGGDTILYHEDGVSVLAKANGGSGGLGGHPDRSVDGGAGASDGSGNIISPGEDGEEGKADRSNLLVSVGGSSGWGLLKEGSDTYPKYSLMYPNNNIGQTLNSVGPFGTGGAGSRGEGDPKNNDSGPGGHGFARIYFIF